MTRPRILITTDVSLNEKGQPRATSYLSYIAAVQRAGGLPILAPPLAELARELLELAHGVVIPGGDDLDAELLGEPPHESIVIMDRRRQDSDLAIIREVLARDVPFLGICLGMQMLAFAAGGKILQDIPSMHPGALEHQSDSANRKRHPVTVEPGTKLASLVGSGEAEVNTTHHQAVRSVAGEVVISARAPDGIIEAIELPQRSFCMGVQWHPEDLMGERVSDPLFAALVTAASQRARNL